MQKVITINLNGNAYQLEESGYNLLTAYLERAESQLRDNPDKAEVVADLEQAIAEKCDGFLGPYKTVVTGAEVERIINQMGPVDGAAGEDASSRAGASAEAGVRMGAGASAGDAGKGSSGTGPGAPKRLYQIREGAMISGVCKGLAAYFNIDVTIVRLIFVGLTVLTYGAWIGAYVVMMFVIPFAKTSEERAAAFGLPFSAQDLIDQAKENYAGFKNNKRWRRHWKHQRRQWKMWRHTIREQARGWEPVMHEPGDHAAWILTGFMAPIFGIVIFGLFLLMGLAIFSLVKTGAIGGWALPGGIPLWAGIVGLVLLFQVLSSPFHAGYHVGHYSSRYRYGHGHDLCSAWGGTVWLALIVFAAWFGYHHVPAIHNFVQSLPSVWHDVRVSLKHSV
jgi:phage shock protein PspC (stress-responsive transcriptional regulator)